MMNPLSICQFDGLTSVKPAVYELESLEQFVEFFTITEPPTVLKEQRGTLFSMAVYKPEASRSKENVEALSGMVLDFDNKKTTQLKLPDFIEQLKQLDLIYLYYTTWSHTETHHRWRVVLPFEKVVEVSLWRDVHDRVLNLLGNPIGLDEVASRDVARMWFMPCKAAKHAPYEVGYSLHGKFLDADTLPPMPQTTLPVVITSEYSETTPADVREALNAIDPSCDYELWLEMGMALHHQLGNSGLAMWNSWSSRGGKKYKGIDELQQKWNSFKSGDGVTIKSLFKRARDTGWRPAPKAAVNYVITTGTPASSDDSTENFEEADEFVDPVEKCLADLLPYAVSDIFDFPNSIIKSTYDWMQGVAPIPVPIFSFGASLSLLAFLKRDAVVSATNLRTNLYILTIGASRSGKNNGLICIHRLLDALGLKELEISAFGSAQGLMKQLSEKDGVAYWVQDEMAHVFKNFQNKNAGTHETRLEQKILTLYNCAYQTSDEIKAEKIAVVENPYLNIYGTTTENIIDNLSPEAAISGLLARFLVFWQKPDKEAADYNFNIDRAIPHRLLEELRTINEQRGNRQVCLEDEAKVWFKSFCKVTQRNQRELCLKGAKVDSLVGNLPEQTIKLALIAAVPHRLAVKAENCTVEYDSPITISLRDIQWAVSVALHCFGNNIAIAGLLTENKNEKYINKILEYLNTHKNKWVKRADLCLHIRYAINVRQLDDLLEPLFESRKIIKAPSKKGGGTLYRLNSTTNKRKLA